MRLIRHPFRRRPATRGQALVEFALVVLPLLLLIVGVVQFGLLLNANVTLTNAAREGARAGSIYRYDVQQSRETNGQRRCQSIVTAVTQALGILNDTAPNFVSGPCPVSAGDTVVAGDITITYAQPNGVLTNDPREGYTLTVTVRYRQDIIVPLVGPLLSTDASGRFVHNAEVTMVVN